MEIEIRVFSAKDKIQVLEISEKEVGKNFIDQDYLNFFLNNPNAMGIVAIIDRKVVGFSFFQWCTLELLSNYILTNKNWLFTTLVKNDQNPRPSVLIGYRNLTAVNRNFQNKGVGSRLVGFSIQELKKKSDIIVNVVWKAENKKDLGQTLQKHGLKSVKRIPGYWREDSLNKKYECAACGPPPCNCTAEIYISTNGFFKEKSSKQG